MPDHPDGPERPTFVTPTGDVEPPSSEEINELPDHIRRWIHDLETRCDPAGTLRQLHHERQMRKQLEAENEELKAEIRRLKKELSKARK